MINQGPLYTEISGVMTRRRLSYHTLEAIIRLPILKPPASMSRLDIAACQASFVAASILLMFFGKNWVEENSAYDAANKFLRGNPKDEIELAMHMARLIELAELLFNMQDVPGLDGVIDQIRGRKIESGFAELEVGKMLIRHRVSYKFVKPTGKKGFDYDIDIKHPNGSMCCGEVKSKAEDETLLTQGTILRSLKNARDQMPPDRAGVIFFKVPHNWYHLPHFFEMFEKSVIAFKSRV